MTTDVDNIKNGSSISEQKSPVKYHLSYDVSYLQSQGFQELFYFLNGYNLL